MSFADACSPSKGFPLQNVRVTATSIPGNVTREARTNREGSYQIAFANGPHDYIMGFSLIGYAFKQFEIKQVADEDVLIADARLSVVQLDTVVSTASNQQRVSRNSQTPDVSGSEQTINNTNLPPELQGDLAAMAASLPGVTLIPGLDGQPDGFSVLGLGADQNTTTMNGMSFNSSICRATRRCSRRSRRRTLRCVSRRLQRRELQYSAGVRIELPHSRHELRLQRAGARVDRSRRAGRRHRIHEPVARRLSSPARSATTSPSSVCRTSSAGIRATTRRCSTRTRSVC